MSVPALVRTLRPMPTDQVWHHVHAERRSLSHTLGTLTPEQWAHPSLCAGWSVRDVAAHVIATPQIGGREVAALFLRNLGRGYNEMIFADVKARGRQPVERILADFEKYADSRAKVATTTPVEPLVDALVHHQDILRPLGLRHDVPVDAALVAADRCRLLAGLMGSRQVVRSVRMEATDADWVRGRGPTLRGPAQELMMVCAGRSAAARDLSGDGLEVLSGGVRPGRRTST